MSFTNKGVTGSGPSATSGLRPPSRNVNRESQEGPLMKRSDSTRSMVDPAAADQKSSKDNIKVAVRIRPLSEKEHTRGDTAVWATDGSGGVGMYSARSSTLNIKYAYDLVFDTATTNAQVFDHVGRPTIEPVTQGISGTLFAYGVTSSGKTHTMMGTAADPGLVPRAIQELFSYISQATDRVFTVTLSMLEIYCEMLNDLLDPSKLNLDVQERELPNGRGAVMQVKRLTEAKVASAEAALGMIQQGLDNRKVGATAYNDQSSRSHTICRFQVEAAPANSFATNSISTTSAANGCAATTRTNAWLTLVDLAGSEGSRAALSKDQQAEARDINRSLLTLGKVVFELAKGNGHVPFRDSLLTRLLKPSLTGNGAKVAIICNVTPASSQSEETWNTLRFADGAKRIKVTAVKNEALDIAAIVAQYQREVEALKAQLAALSGAAAAGNLTPAVLQAMQASLQDSTTANTADHLADQEAQMRYLEESNRNLNLERDQLLAMNRRMMAMLVDQIKGLCGPGVSSSSSSSAISEGLAAVTHLRRSLSFESAQYYSMWQGSQQQQQWQIQQQPSQTADHGLIRITADDIPDSITAGTIQAARTTARSISDSSISQSHILPASALQQNGDALLPLANPGLPVVPASIYFPGSRRTSKTLALAVPGRVEAPEGATAAAWLGPVATVTAAAAAAAGFSAVSEAVEAHRKLADCQARLDLLLQLLEDKEDLLKEARQMQEGQALQLRLTITAADRALLRDKLAEAEQQLASYHDILKEYEAEKEELYDTAYSLYGKVQKLTEQNHAASAEMQQLKSKLAGYFGNGNVGRATASAAYVSGESIIGRGSPCSTSTSPVPPSSPVRTKSTAAAAAAGRGMSQQIQSIIGTAGGAASPVRHTPSPVHSSGSSIGLGRTLPRSPSQISGVGGSSLNPICISSPFSDPAAAAAAAAGLPRPRTARTASGGSLEGSPLAGSPGGSSSLSASPSACSPLLSSALSSGASRIPLPPCLQHRPKQLQGNDVRLMRFVTGHSRLPGAPSSNSSSAASSIGGALLSSSSTCSLPFSMSANSTAGGADSTQALAAVGPRHLQQSQMSSLGRPVAGGGRTGSPNQTRGLSILGEVSSSSHYTDGPPPHQSTSAAVVGTKSYSADAAASIVDQPSNAASSVAPAFLGPAARLKSQPGLLAVAAAISEGVSNTSSVRGLATGAATGEDIRKLWEALPQAGMVVRLSDEDGNGANQDFRIAAGTSEQ